ncbi:MAG: hypothetical protein AB1635_00520 [Acidobacteriota bacterium]
MAAGEGVTAQLDALVELFNRKGMDLPDGLFDRRTQFVLNGAPYETLLGRDPDDPLVRMIARGPAGYRFAAKALQHALPDAALARGELDLAEGPEGPALRGRVWLSGHARDTGERVDTVVAVELWLDGATVVRAAADVDVAALETLRRARLAP